MKLVAEVRPVPDPDFPAGLRFVITEHNVVRHDPYFGSGAGESDLVWGPPGSRFVVVRTLVKQAECFAAYSLRNGWFLREEIWIRGNNGNSASGRIKWGIFDYQALNRR